MNESENMDMKLNVQDLRKSLQHFDWIDYNVFAFMLTSCAVVGVYFGFIDKKRKRKDDVSNNATEVAQEYLMGGRTMSVLPVAMSLVAR